MIRCNWCMRVFEDEDDLAIIEADGEHFHGCPDCNTDEYLIEVDE